MGFLNDLFGGGAASDAADKNRALYTGYGAQGKKYLDEGLAKSEAALNEAYTPLAALGTKYGAGTSLYLDALGVNGADKATAAQSSFTKSPGFDAGIDAGIDVLNRRRAAGGMLDSGNADLDALTFGQNAQNKEYGGWLDRLGGLINPEMAATTGASGVKTGLAGLYQTDATNRINLDGSVTSGMAGANNAEAAGKQAGMSNLLSLGTNLLGLATSGFGTAAGKAAGSSFNFAPMKYAA